MKTKQDAIVAGWLQQQFEPITSIALNGKAYSALPLIMEHKFDPRGGFYLLHEENGILFRYEAKSPNSPMPGQEFGYYSVLYQIVIKDELNQYKQKSLLNSVL